jgi:hypothetical protein
MAKGKGFQKNNNADDDAIWVESMVASRTLTPAVKMKWGQQEGLFDPETARQHAYAVLEAISAAELDACLMRWAIDKLKASPEHAAQIVILFRQKRESGALPSVTLNLGKGEHLRPDTVKQRATQLFDSAFGTEVEAFLMAFLLQDLEQSPEVAGQILMEFREMRGAKTMWPEEESKNEQP